MREQKWKQSERNFRKKSKWFMMKPKPTTMENGSCSSRSIPLCSSISFNCWQSKEGQTGSSDQACYSFASEGPQQAFVFDGGFTLKKIMKSFTFWCLILSVIWHCFRWNKNAISQIEPKTIIGLIWLTFLKDSLDGSCLRFREEGDI